MAIFHKNTNRNHIEKHLSTKPNIFSRFLDKVGKLIDKLTKEYHVEERDDEVIDSILEAQPVHNVIVEIDDSMAGFYSNV